MSSNISSFSFDENVLKEEVKQYMTIRAQQACQYARDILQKEAASCMEKFYNQISPVFYQRTFEVRDYSVQPFYKQYGSLIVGGVFIDGYNLSLKKTVDSLNSETDPEKNEESPHATVGTKESGYNHKQGKTQSVWMFGEHGGKEINAGIRMSPTPHDLLEKFWKMNKNKCISYGANAAKSINYRLLSFK